MVDKDSDQTHSLQAQLQAPPDQREYPRVTVVGLGRGRVHATCCGRVEPTQGALGKSHWSDLGAPRGLCLRRAGVQEATGWPRQPEKG